MNDKIPIYKDEKFRDIVDNLDSPPNKNFWYPSNKASQLLWRCLESLRDISTSLESYLSVKNESKKRRIIKNISIPLHSLATSINDLCNGLTCNPEIKKEIPKGKLKEISKINNHFIDLLSVKWDSNLSLLRNKLSAHIDKDIYPFEMGNILIQNDTSTLGKYIHICLHVLIDLLEINVFSWTCELEGYSTFNIMTNEPFLVCLARNNDKIEYINCIYIVNNSPKETIVKILDEIVSKSQWMFDENDMRIRSIYRDERGNKEKFLSNIYRYKKI